MDQAAPSGDKEASRPNEEAAVKIVETTLL